MVERVADSSNKVSNIFNSPPFLGPRKGVFFYVKVQLANRGIISREQKMSSPLFNFETSHQ